MRGFVKGKMQNPPAGAHKARPGQKAAPGQWPGAAGLLRNVKWLD